MEKEIDELKYKINLILSGIRNILEQNNENGVSNYLIKLIDEER